MEAFKKQFDRGLMVDSMVALESAVSASHFGISESRMVESKSVIAPQFTLQRAIRPEYGKADVGPSSFGTHPDFAHLADTQDTADCPIVTLFMDIESSTRLELLFGPKDAARIKNAFLTTAIEVVRAFDGHVHRLQGDAVIAFFGGVGAREEDAVVDAVNCASILWLFVKSHVIPTLKEVWGDKEEFGIRIGVDYAEDAHWCAFGYPGAGEVTASGLGVSTAAKLQQAAGRNQVMLGQRLIEFLDLPDVVTIAKKVTRSGEEVDEPYLIPNITHRDGTPLNYRKRILRVEEYLRCGPLADAAAEIIGIPRFQPLQLSMTIHDEKGVALRPFAPASGVLAKGEWIRFNASLIQEVRVPATVRFEVENHGAEAREKGGENSDDHHIEYNITRASQLREIVHWEHARYRGLHYMTITVTNAGGVRARRRVGVYIE